NGAATLSSATPGLFIRTTNFAVSGSLDLTRGYLIVDYSGSSPLATVAAALAAGYNAGAWNGTAGAINSSTAASTPGTALGFGEASAALGPSGGTCAGETVDATMLMVS